MVIYMYIFTINFCWWFYVGWFTNYLSDRCQSVYHNGCSSSILNISSGVPQGSVLGPILFSIYADVLGRNIPNANFHFYADDTVLYCFGSTLNQAFDCLQTAFTLLENQLIDLKLVLNVSKTKLMLFSNGRKVSDPPPSLFSSQGNQIELVTHYKYLGILIDDRLSFKTHI